MARVNLYQDEIQKVIDDRGTDASGKGQPCAPVFRKTASVCFSQASSSVTVVRRLYFDGTDTRGLLS